MNGKCLCCYKLMKYSVLFIITFFLNKYMYLYMLQVLYKTVVNNKNLFFAEIESMHKTAAGSYSWRNYLIERRIVVILLCLSSYVGALTTQKQLSGKPVTYTIPLTLSSRYCN